MLEFAKEEILGELMALNNNVAIYSLTNSLEKSKSLANMRRGSLMVSALNSEASSPGSTGSSPGRGHCVLFYTHYSHSASLNLGL